MYYVTFQYNIHLKQYDLYVYVSLHSSWLRLEKDHGLV